jgi:hypothetical protein
MESTTPSKPVLSRFERPYSPGGGTSAPTGTPVPDGTVAAAVAMPLPPRTIGSKIPINRRHRRRR